MRRGYRYRIYPNDEQQIQFSKTFGCCRFIYNRMLSDKIRWYEKHQEMLRTTPAQYKKEYEWLKEVDSLALANVQLDLEQAYRKFFREAKAGFPRYKRKRNDRQSYTTNVVNNNIRLEGGRIVLPKAGKVKIVLHRHIPEEAKLKSVTIVKEGSGKYYASLLCELPESESQREAASTEEAKILGIDYAMEGMGVFSDGTKAEYPGYYRKEQKKLAREQRKLSHCVKGSRNYDKQRKRVALCHEKIRNQRSDHQHKLSRRLADQFDAVSVEDLDMKALSRCLRLGKGVMDNAYGSFLRKLEYKLEEQGKELIKIDRWYPSSQICSNCGSIHPEVKDLKVRSWYCDECNQFHDRDINAAKNIREEGRRLLKEKRESA
ncbi:MAG: transposase [Firmicutes bacterium]|nr:transposase [Bacillota bacterium]